MISKSTKNQLWENNHFLIIQAISNFIQEHGKMPTKNNIATDAKLSGQTVHNHIKDFDTHSLYGQQMHQFKILSDRVMAKVLQMAIAGEGNVKAARLYLEAMGGLGNNTNLTSKINTQNNYIQINGTVLS